MNYEKKYKEALGWMQSLYDGLHGATKEDAEHYFPELKESEDEIVRKWIIDYLNNRILNSSILDEKESCKKALAWLEKQGELVNSLSKGLDNAHERIDGLIQKNNLLIKQLEKKQSEQKPNPYSGTSFEYNGHTWGMCARDNGVEILIDGHIKGRVFTDDSHAKEMFIKALERVEEQNNKGYKLTDCDKNSWWEDFKAYASCTIQKPADKVEPKFHEGEWITNGDYTWQIVMVKSLDYILQSQGGNIVEDTISHVDEHFHSFTIQDAKDGDILHSTGWHSDCIFIFNGLDNWKFDEPNGDRAVATGYCCLSVSADNMEFGIQGPNWVKVNTIKPATKIQRDLLLQKMKEASYEWDTEKKELKKIEQKKDMHNKLTDFKYSLKHIMEEAIECGDTHNLNADADMLLRLVQNSAWSEEDEYHKRQILRILKDNGCSQTLQEKTEKWIEERLKSLSSQINITDEELAQAKKDAYNDALGKIEYHSGEPTFDDGWSAAIWYLKKRNARPQTTWKPSDEQITWLYRAVDDASKDSRMKQVLNNLLLDLKKL